ncbi:MarR family transcriptional regulator [Acuticoccus sp. M5D2P5]|uniref:MarR family winged helix-turn-helix transcriptional regulator n=1 Tax=Acuticoccus kalidii TaxID=2910977 RepID=UPI001F3532B3|nr:MarR family transcriptional regulator [Acuticoccus kalidii]MCF3932379.1 MarR family transcriptional regulator [Acuticoccus kalidii]
MTASGDYILDDQIGYLMRLASQRHTAIFQERIAEGLTPPQFTVLIRLAEGGPTSQNQLGRLAGLDNATVKGVVDRLKTKGLITLSVDEKDSRRRVIDLSEHGRALVPELCRRGHSITEETLEPLTAREREQLLRLLRKLV